MAAVLKKRVVAEFAHVVPEEPKPPPAKKLRLIYRPKPSKFQINLRSCEEPRQTFQVLQRLEQELPLAPEHVQATIDVLLDHYAREKEAAVRARVISLVSELARAPSCKSTAVVNDLKNLLLSEKSDTALSQLISALQVIGQSQSKNTGLHVKIIDTIAKFLSSVHHNLRCKCLELIGALGFPDQEVISTGSTSAKKQSLRCVLAERSHDEDCRVRSSALQAMLSWHQRGLKLEQEHYGIVCEALKDDQTKVRLLAVKLVWAFSQLYPNMMVNLPNSKETIRLVDDGFAKICTMVTDVSMKVRAEAASLLGSLHLVTPRFLYQTLDKKLMSNMRKKRSAHERQREHFESGEWSTGQKWADDAPREEVDPENVSLITAGACGAFVHGLEDEYLEVRNSAIDSLCELAYHTPNFACMSQDYLVDMFNDEIESVRLNAINSLRKICAHFQLREDQLDIILNVLRDFNVEIRDCVREMLGCCRLSNKACLMLVKSSLTTNIDTYPEDKHSVWNCLKNIGERHVELTLSVVPELLNIHPHFESIESDVQDPAYICNLILVFNAAESRPTITQLLPAHIITHYRYLRDKYSNLVPFIKVMNSSSLEDDVDQVEGSTENIDRMLRGMLHRLDDLQRLGHQAQIQLLHLTIRDIERVGRLRSECSGSVSCLIMFLKCMLYLNKGVKVIEQSNQFAVDIHGQDLLATLVKNMLTLCNKMEYMFLGLGVSELIEVKEMRLKAESLRLLGQLCDASHADGKSLCVRHLKAVVDLQTYLSDSVDTSSGERFLTQLSSEQEVLNNCDPTSYRKVVERSLRCRSLRVLDLTNHVRQATATIVEPSGSSDNVFRFTSGLAVEVPFLCIIENVTCLDQVYIQIKYPDQQTRLVLPSAGDFREVNSLKQKLLTRVLLSHTVWTEAGSVQIGLVLKCPVIKERSSGKVDNLLELTKPVSVTIFPTPCKR